MPFYNRPGFKLTQKGVQALDDAELLSIIFWANDKEDDVLDISNKILRKYNLHKIEDAGYNELVRFICDGKKAEYPDFVKAMKLLSVIELSKRYNRLVQNGYKKRIRSAQDVYGMFSDMRTLKKEVLKVVLLDTKNFVIGIKEISVGTLNSSLVDPRGVFKEAFKESAHALILVHNHPSGDMNPSSEDIEITEKLSKLGEEIGIKVLDHIIIGNGYWSWREKLE